MRIVLSCRTYPTQRPGGMPFVCQDRAEALAKLNHEVFVLTTGGGPEKQMLNGVEVRHLSCPPQQYTTEFAQACTEACTEISPDIIHLDSFDRSHPWWDRRPGNPSVVGVTMHGFGLGSWLSKWNLYLDRPKNNPPALDVKAMQQEAFFLNKADVVIGISRHEYWQLCDVYNLAQARLVYNPIAPYFFDRKVSPPPKDGYFLCIGNPGTSGNRHFQAAQQAATRIGSTARVVKGTERSQIPTLYRGARALVLPTFWSQGYDLTVAEAHACERPVIATCTGSYGREGVDNPAIILVPRGDNEALMKAMAGPLPTVPKKVAHRHRPEVHAAEWLAVMQEAM